MASAVKRKREEDSRGSIDSEEEQAAADIKKILKEQMDGCTNIMKHTKHLTDSISRQAYQQAEEMLEELRRDCTNAGTAKMKVQGLPNILQKKRDELTRTEEEMQKLATKREKLKDIADIQRHLSEAQIERSLKEDGVNAIEAKEQTTAMMELAKTLPAVLGGTEYTKVAHLVQIIVEEDPAGKAGMYAGGFMGEALMPETEAVAGLFRMARSPTVPVTPARGTKQVIVRSPNSLVAPAHWSPTPLVGPLMPAGSEEGVKTYDLFTPRQQKDREEVLQESLRLKEEMEVRKETKSLVTKYSSQKKGVANIQGEGPRQLVQGIDSRQSGQSPGRT